MAIKKELDAVEIVDTSEWRTLLPEKSDRRQSLVDTFTAAILSAVKFDLDGKMPNQEQRNKIVSFAVKMADAVIAATV